MKLGLGVFL